MGRRRGELALLMEVASGWNWKVSAFLVPFTFCACHVAATVTEHVRAPATPAGLAPIVIVQGIHASAVLLQYVFPIIFLFSALASFIRRSRSSELLEGVRNDPRADLAALSWLEFEALVGEGFRHRGFEVEQRGGSTPDGGVDLAMARGRERFLVQCKQWRAQRIGVSVVRELYGVMAAEHVAGGYVVTSGFFTRDAKEFAAGRNIELIDGRALQALLREGQDSLKPIDSTPPSRAYAPQAPICPKCSAAMVLRTAKRGSHAGRSFWGCRHYPRCRAIVARE